jgi:hypothetical protein
MTSLYIHADLNSIQDKLDRHLLKGKTAEEVRVEALKEGTSAEEALVWLRATKSALEMGMTDEEAQAEAERVTLTWKRGKQGHHLEALSLSS